MVVVTSIRLARRRLRYESWHLLHLYAYLGVGLALPHQLWTGQQFLGSPGRTVFWWTAWAVAAGAILVWRVALPAYRTVRHDLRVTSVVREADGVVSVYVTGRDLERATGRGRAVLHLALPGGPRLVPGAPLLALGRARRPQPADHREGPRRRQPRRGPPAARHPRPGRGPVRPAQRPGPHPAARRPDRRRRRHHAAALAGRGAGLRAGRGGAGAPVRRPAAVRRASSPSSPPSAGSGWSTCPGTGRTRPTSPALPCCTTSPTSPTATSTSAAPSSGPTRSAGPPSPPAFRPSTSTSRPSRGDPPMKRIVLWLLSTVSAVVLLFGYHTSTSGPAATAQAPVGASLATTSTDDHVRRHRRPAHKQSTGTTTAPAQVAQTRWGPVQVQITTDASGTITDVEVVQYPSGNREDEQINSYALPRAGPGDPGRPERRHRHGQRRHRHERGLPPVAAVGARPGPGMTTVTRPAPARYVEHVMGMPISLALRGRHTDDDAARGAWAEALAALRDVDRVFSTYRADSFVSRLARDEITVDGLPAGGGRGARAGGAGSAAVARCLRRTPRRRCSTQRRGEGLGRRARGPAAARAARTPMSASAPVGTWSARSPARTPRTGGSGSRTPTTRPRGGGGAGAHRSGGDLRPRPPRRSRRRRPHRRRTRRRSPRSPSSTTTWSGPTSTRRPPSPWAATPPAGCAPAPAVPAWSSGRTDGPSWWGIRSQVSGPAAARCRRDRGGSPRPAMATRSASGGSAGRRPRPPPRTGRR